MRTVRTALLAASLTATLAAMAGVSHAGSRPLDPYTDGAATGSRDIYSEGARSDARGPYSDGARAASPAAAANGALPPH